ncbi:hypothetical protein BELL_0624g00010 [Botrytis elliptica]|uniref:NACHT domain-containing protein n=1 Tax=Botrytis elliptica TaxID=278938 RepID=A0A4Z1JBR7_9HELO|nr:hypothetical protein BELL_0624g00010 [Botrytis elliptica]
MAAPVAASVNARDPWLIARNRFIDQLDPAEQALFNEATPENLYYKSSNIQKADQKNSKTRAILKSLEPLTKSIQDYGAAMDTFTNIAPLYLAPIWGSIRVILVLASSQGKFYDRIIDTFARVGDILPRLREYQAIFDHEKHPKFTQTLSAAYLDIIVLCSNFKNILTGQKSSFVKRLRSPLSTSLGAQLDNAVQTFREHRKAVESEAKMCHYIEAKESRELELRERMRSKEQERRDRLRRIISQMAAVDCRNKHRRLQKIRHSGTGSWLAGVADYRNWQNQNKSSVISCYGIPGSGKSVLVSSLIDGSKLAFPADTAISYYYCDYADKRTLSPSGLFGFISQKLFRDMNEIPEALIAILEAEYPDEATSPSLDQIVALLIKAIDELSSVAIFIDGLDELPESDRKLTFSILKKIVNEATSPVKLFVSSREDVTYLFRTSSDLNTFKVHLQTNSISPDIEAYIKHTIDELITSGNLVLGNLALKDDIFNVLRDGAKGMFLWVQFQLEELCRMETDATIVKALQNLPRNLEETYDRLLGRIIEIERREFVKRMFDWIICSCRPLHMDELREAIAFTVGDKSWDSTKIPNDLRRLIRACGNLIMIDEETLEVHLAHYTVEQYILHSQNSELAYFHTTREESNRALGVTCVTYLSFTDLEAQVTVYHNTISPNMTMLQDAVTTQSLIPRASQSSNFPVKAAKAALMVQKFKKDHESNIDYSRHIQIRKKEMANQQFLDKYRLIGYLKENWLSHTKDFTLDTFGEIGELFRKLLFTKQLTFSFKPWERLSFRDRDEIAPLCWAIAEDNLPLLRELLVNDRRIFDHISEACSLFWSTIGYHKKEGGRQGIDIPDKSLMVLDYYSPENISSKLHCLFWLYGGMIMACRRGNGQLLDICVEFIDQRKMPYFTGALGQPTLRSLVLSHLCLEATIHGHLMLIQSFQADVYFPLSLSYEYKGTYFNSLERAMTLPCDEIIDSLLKKHFPVSYKAKLTALQNTNLKALIESGDSRKLNRLLQFLFKSDGESWSSHPFFGIHDQSYMQDVRKYKHNAIFTAASLGFCHHLKMILQLQSASTYAEDIIERNIAFLAAINSSHSHIVSWLLFSDIHKNSYYWLEPIPAEVYDQGSKSMSITNYATDLQEISEKFRLFVIDAISNACVTADSISSLSIFERHNWILTRAIAQNKPEQVIVFGGRKYFNHEYECLASDLPDLPQEVEEYIWPNSHDHEKPKATVPLIWAVIYNQPQVVKALLSEPLLSCDYYVIKAATTCAIMMDSVEMVMLLEPVLTIKNYDPNTLEEGNFFFTNRDLLDRVFAQGRYYGANPHLKVARYIKSWGHDHRKNPGSHSQRMRLLQEYLEATVIADDDAFDNFTSAQTINTPSDETI